MGRLKKNAKFRGFVLNWLIPNPSPLFGTYKFKTFWSEIGTPPSFRNMGNIGNKIVFKTAFLRLIFNILEYYKSHLFTLHYLNQKMITKRQIYALKCGM